MYRHIAITAHSLSCTKDLKNLKIRSYCLKVHVWKNSKNNWYKFIIK